MQDRKAEDNTDSDWIVSSGYGNSLWFEKKNKQGELLVQHNIGGFLGRIEIRFLRKLKIHDIMGRENFFEELGFVSLGGWLTEGYYKSKNSNENLKDLLKTLEYYNLGPSKDLIQKQLPSLFSEDFLNYRGDNLSLNYRKLTFFSMPDSLGFSRKIDDHERANASKSYLGG